MAGVVRKPHGHEGVELVAELEKLLVRQRGPVSQDVIGEDEQPAEALAEQPFPLGQAHQVVPRRPVLPVLLLDIAAGKFPSLHIDQPTGLARAGYDEVAGSCEHDGTIVIPFAAADLRRKAG